MTDDEETGASAASAAESTGRPDAEAPAETDGDAIDEAGAEASADAEADTIDESAPDTTAEESSRERIERALEAVRREGLKAAAVYAVLDATAVFLAVNLLLATAAPAGLPDHVVTAAVAAVVALVAELWFRTRRSLVEQFEAANPEVAGPLRTARDAVERGTDTRMAARLYEEVIERLRETSGVALVDSRRVAATAVVVVLLSAATVQVSIVGLSLFGTDEDVPEGEVEPGGALTPENDGLRDGSEVLGDPDSVDRGDDETTAELETNEGDGPVEEERSFPSDGGGSTGGYDVESQQAGFEEGERLEDAELVRKYNVRIREDE
ncbi:DUF7502 family protein [Natronomonas marina]|uniref:DUF7502 family protein n=1 Tax=Natronomonas marina TaxID=2961939 RepID=UPI0020C9E6DC|nr:hypothetical protein [Natronomonas marina]